MANMPKLVDELSTDPLTRGYSGMTDAEVVTSLYTEDRTVKRDTVPTYEIVGATVQSEYAANVDTIQKEQRFWGIMGLGEVDVGNTNVKNFLWNLFPAGTVTRANYIALVNETVSRAVELGLGNVTVGDVIAARAQL